MARLPSGRSIEQVAGAEILDRDDRAERRPVLGFAAEPDQVGVIIFAGLERRQLGARDRQQCAAQRLGGVAVGNFVEPGDRAAAAGPKPGEGQASARRPTACAA